MSKYQSTLEMNYCSNFSESFVIDIKMPPESARLVNESLEVKIKAKSLV